MAVGPVQSPLKQVNVPGSKKAPSKFESCWSELCGEAELFKAKTTKEVEQYLSELLCLDVNELLVYQKVHELTIAQLLGPYKNNVSCVFAAAVKTLKEANKTDTRRLHAVQTLVPLLKSLLSRPYDNYNYDVMSLLAGHIDRSDPLFTDLVSAIDMILQSEDLPLVLRHRTLQLAILIVASVNQGSLTSFFLRRDLFGTLTSFIVDEGSSKYAFEGAILLGLLANYRKFDTRNPYLVRMEDLVDDNVMLSILDTASACATNCRDGYTQLTADDANDSFVASLTSLVSSMSITHLWRLDFSLPPRPPSRKGKEKATNHEHEHKNGADTNGRPSLPAVRQSDTNTQFAKLPNELVIVLLPFYDMLSANKAFGSLICSDASDAFLASSLISLSSYVFTHATTSPRGKTYARFCLICLDLVLQESEGKLVEEEDDVRLCRQRQPMMRRHGQDRPLISSLLDASVMYLRYNIQKKLEVDSYMAMEVLRLGGASPAYDWTVVWRTLLTLSAFIVARQSEIVHPRLNELMTQILLTLAYAIYWSQAFLPSIESHVAMYYEVLHGEPALSGLAGLLGVGDTDHKGDDAATSVSVDEPRQQASDTKTPTRTPTSTSRLTMLSPRYSTSHVLSAAGNNGNRAHRPPIKRMSDRAIALDAWTILDAVLRFFMAKIDDARQKNGFAPRAAAAVPVNGTTANGQPSKEANERVVDQDELEAEDVLGIIGAHVGGPDLIDSDAVSEVERYDERENEAFMRQLVATVCHDALKLVPVKSPF